MKERSCVFGRRLFETKDKTNTETGKRDYMRQYMREYRKRKGFISEKLPSKMGIENK